jgi:hypothetical protein
MANTIRSLAADAAGFEVLPSAARTTTPDTQEFEIVGRGYGYAGLHLIIDVTAVTSTPSLVVTVSGVDRVSGKTYALLTSAAIATAVTTVLRVSPGATPAANLAVGDNLPPVFRITVTHGNANSATYSVAGMLV